MKVLIYSDVHGNLPAFEEMLKTVGHCDEYICLGDLVNYGPWSNECVDLAMSLPNSTLLMGNHEEAFLEGAYPGNNDLVKLFFNETFNNFKKISQIKSFQKAYQLDEYCCQHTIFNQYIYPDTAVQLDNNYIIGHSHHQFKYTEGGYTLYNAGSVGQNRRHINVINYLIYDTETSLISMEKTTYPLEKLLNEMKARRYPSVCLEYYSNKAMF